MKLAALDMLQHSLARYAEFLGGLDHRQIAWWCLLDETGAQFFGHPNAPGSARSDLLADNETRIEPAVKRRRDYTQNLGGFLDRDQVAFCDLGLRLIPIHFVVAPEIADVSCRESLASCRFPPLPIENAGDDVIRI